MDNRKKIRFWPLLGIVLGADALLVFAYTVIIPGLTGRALSDTFCSSALVLGLVACVPVLFDVGRGVVIGGQMSGNEADRRAVLEKEHQRREQGMVVSFALAVATLIITLLSFLIGLM